jgi:NADH-quinone oxidoreductase subunit J
VLLIMQSPFSGAKGDAPAAAVLKDGASYAVGIKMFSEYLLAFEIVGVFLLGAIIGAIVLAKTPTGDGTEKGTVNR